MIPILIEIQGDKQLASGFAQISTLIENLRPVFEKLRDRFFPSIQKRFDAAGPGWQSLTRSTEAEKARKGYGPSRILVATKALYNSFAIGAGGSIERIAAQEAEFGSSIFYGVFHQEGRGVPERKVIDVSPQEEQEYAEDALEVVAEKIRSFGFEIA